MPKILGIEFAPLHLPLRRRLQTLAVFLGATEFMMAGIWSTIFMIFLLFTPFFIIPLLYFAWMIYDKDTFNEGGRLWPTFRRLPIWRYYAEYFPVTIHKTADLDPSKNYIFGYHPHGIMAAGAFANFATEATDFSKKFPGITTRLITLEINFWMPFHRETALFNGICSANKESIEWIISKNGKGNAAVIVIGGAAESLDAVPNTMELTLKNRKGFVKLALKHGASLVPCISFGENELFSQTHQDDKSTLKKIQRKLTRLIRVAPPIFHGRGVLQYNYGFLPYRKPINTIVGKPIDVEKVAKPTEEDINKLHAAYVKALTDLFYAYREKYAENPQMEIVIK
ncbi:2-acylglycerol O-acyltransferase 2-like protein [Dinothrombium tinctorium]|uniref:Acyltransferase n=1 Tax=Dinothrombium tinctorium TaxID=1965070 RepID=A0A443RR63_9ACAR|nr:2-acylglycerol O-acyltransferase 2-like protein [Dinothrombium tinctorium]